MILGTIPWPARLIVRWTWTRLLVDSHIWYFSYLVSDGGLGVLLQQHCWLYSVVIRSRWLGSNLNVWSVNIGFSECSWRNHGASSQKDVWIDHFVICRTWHDNLSNLARSRTYRSESSPNWYMDSIFVTNWLEALHVIIVRAWCSWSLIQRWSLLISNSGSKGISLARITLSFSHLLVGAILVRSRIVRCSSKEKPTAVPNCNSRGSLEGLFLSSGHRIIGSGSYILTGVQGHHWGIQCACRKGLWRFPDVGSLRVFSRSWTYILGDFCQKHTILFPFLLNMKLGSSGKSSFLLIRARSRDIESLMALLATNARLQLRVRHVGVNRLALALKSEQSCPWIESSSVKMFVRKIARCVSNSFLTPETSSIIRPLVTLDTRLFIGFHCSGLLEELCARVHIKHPSGLIRCPGAHPEPTGANPLRLHLGVISLLSSIVLRVTSLNGLEAFCLCWNISAHFNCGTINWLLI